MNVSADNHPYIAVLGRTSSGLSFYSVVASCVTSCAAGPTANFNVLADLTEQSLPAVPVFESRFALLARELLLWIRISYFVL